MKTSIHHTDDHTSLYFGDEEDEGRFAALTYWHEQQPLYKADGSFELGFTAEHGVSARLSFTILGYGFGFCLYGEE